VCQRVQPVAALERYVVLPRATFIKIEWTGRSVDTSHGLRLFPTKELGLLSSLPTHAGAHHTSCAHRRLPLPLPPSPSSWPSSPSPADS